MFHAPEALSDINGVCQCVHKCAYVSYLHICVYACVCAIEKSQITLAWFRDDKNLVRISHWKEYLFPWKSMTEVKNDEQYKILVNLYT